jgi:hypothetical protein
VSEEREQIEAELAAITPGDWEFNESGGRDYTDEYWAQFEVVSGGKPVVVLGDDDQSEDDAKFIANAPAHVRSLLDANDTLRTALVEAQSWIEGARQVVSKSDDAKRAAMIKRISLLARIREALEAGK